MTNHDLWNSLEYLDEDLILAAGKRPGSKDRRKLPTRVLLVAVLAIILAATAVGTYVKWSLGKPETYSGPDVQIQSSQDVTFDAETGQYATEDGEPAATDQEFLDQARSIMATLGDDIDTSQMVLVHERNQRWDRDEVRITFPQDEADGEISFDTATGYLLRIAHYTDVPLTVEVPLTEAEALAAATEWYETLPYAPGYEFSGINAVVDDGWIYSFSRQVEVEIGGQPMTLTNYYEEARITIDPRTGEFQASNAFYVPLLDDHEPGDVPLTEADALAIAMEAAHIDDLDRWDITAEITIALPDWFWTDDFDWQNMKTADITRLAWTFTFRDDGEFVTEHQVNVDLYTGQVLGGGTTG